MKKTFFFIAWLFIAFCAQAQMSKSEAETFIKGINFAEIKNIYLIRTREHNGTAGWSEKSEDFDPKTCKWEFGENCLKAEGGSYTVLIPYNKIKVIFLKKASYLTIELVD